VQWTEFCQKVGDVGSFAADGVAHEAEGYVAEPHPNLHHDNDNRHRGGGETDTTLRGGQREVCGNPEVESPPGEEAAGVHQGDDDGERQELASKDFGKTAEGCCRGIASFFPDFRLFDAALDP
jgi:hypothetical protein